MALENIENKRVNTNSLKSPKRSTRIISESTGLAKFNITRKIQEREASNEKFHELESKVQDNTDELKIKTHHGLKLSVSPSRSSSSIPKDSNIGMINDQLMLELASKQREVLELKNQMDQLKKKLSISEKELWEIEKKCNRSTASTLPPALSPINKKRTPPIRSTPMKTMDNGNTFTNNLKKKISINQLNTKQSLSTLQKNFQKDSSIFWERSINAINSLKTDFIKEINNEKEYDSDSDISDYGCADTSDYQLAVK